MKKQKTNSISQHSLQNIPAPGPQLIIYLTSHDDFNLEKDFDL